MDSPIKTYSIQFETYFARISSEVSVRTTIKVTTSGFISVKTTQGFLNKAMNRKGADLTLEEMVEEIFTNINNNIAMGLGILEVHGEYEYCGVLYTCDLKK